MSKDAGPDWLRIEQYQQRYNVSRSTVIKWLEAGLLTIFRVEKVVRIKDQPPSDGQVRHKLRAVR